MRIPELLVPASSLEVLKTAVMLVQYMQTNIKNNTIKIISLKISLQYQMMTEHLMKFQQFQQRNSV